MRARVTRDGRGVHGSMFLAIDGDITAVEARFLGRLAGGWRGWLDSAEVERGRAEVEREKVVGGAEGVGRNRRGRGSDTRPLGRDEGRPGCRGCLMQDGCSGSQRLSRLQTRVREEIQLVAELPNVKETPHGGGETRLLVPLLPCRRAPSRRYAHTYTFDAPTSLFARLCRLCLEIARTLLAELIRRRD